jgi:hypothetical protein
MRKRILALSLGAALATTTVPNAEGRSRVVVLGTRTPNPDPERFRPSVAVVVDETSYLVGLRRRRGAARRGRGAHRHQGAERDEPEARVCDPPALGPHTLGLADLILTRRGFSIATRRWAYDLDVLMRLVGFSGSRVLRFSGSRFAVRGFAVRGSRFSGSRF